MIMQKQIEVAKEIDEVGVALVSLLADIKAKKPIAEIATGNLTKLYTAVEGIDQVDDEVKANKQVAFQTLGMHTGAMAGVLIG